jgi:hypothetical protein
MDLFHMSLVSRLLHGCARDDQVWHAAYCAVFPSSLLAYTQLSPRCWRQLFIRHASLRIRWRKYQLAGVDPFESVYAVDTELRIVSYIEVTGTKDANACFSLYMQDSSVNKVVTMNATTSRVLNQFTLDHADHILEPDGINIGDDVLFSTLYLHETDDYVKAVWFYYYRYEAKRIITLWKLTNGQVPDLHIPTMFMNQDKYYVFGICLQTECVIFLSFYMDAYAGWGDVKCSVFGYPGQTAASYDSYVDYPDVVLIYPKDNPSHIQVWNVHQSNKPLVLLEGLDSIDLENDFVMSEYIKYQDTVCCDKNLLK